MTADTVPVLSVVLIAFNGPTQLHRCIASLKSQTRIDECEVVIVSKVTPLPNSAPAIASYQIPIGVKGGPVS